MSSQSTKVARCCMQQLYSAGAFHPSVAADLRDALAQRFEPADYPPTFLYARGFRCGCLDFFTDPCRMEFRRVRIRLLCLHRWTLFTPPPGRGLLWRNRLSAGCCELQEDAIVHPLPCYLH